MLPKPSNPLNFNVRQLENDDRAMLELTPAKNNNNDPIKYPSESAESTDSDISSVDGVRDGLDTSDGFDYESFKVWGEIIRDWEENMKRRPKFIRDLTHKGIPEAMRCIVWQYFTGAWESSLVGKYADLIQVRVAHTLGHPTYDHFTINYQVSTFLHNPLLIPLSQNSLMNPYSPLRDLYFTPTPYYNTLY